MFFKLSKKYFQLKLKPIKIFEVFSLKNYNFIVKFVRFKKQIRKVQLTVYNKLNYDLYILIYGKRLQKIFFQISEKNFMASV